MKKFLYLLVFLVGMNIPGFCQGSTTYPVTDDFSVAGPLSSNWTQVSPVPSGYVSVVSNGTAAVSSTGSGKGLAIYTGASFESGGITDEYAQATVYGSFTETSNDGICVRMDTSGNGMCWIKQTAKIAIMHNGVFSSELAGNAYCPFADGPVRLSVTGQDYTCTSLSNNTSQTFTDSAATFSSGQPALLVDQTSSANFVFKNFQADCANAHCGHVPQPTANPVPGTYGIVPSGVTLSALSGATICYRVDGVDPSATTPGTCDSGSTTYSSPISAPEPGITIKALATRSDLLNSDVVTLAYNVPGVTINPNSRRMDWPVLADSVVTINSYINFGTTNKCNWSVRSQTGGATATLSNTSGLCVTTVTVGPTAGTCSASGKIANIVGHVSGGSITSVTINDGGQYTPNSSFTISFHDESGNSQDATATTDGTGAITQVTLLPGGSTGWTADSDYRRVVYPNPYHSTSTASFIVTAQSQDDETKTADFYFPVCQDTASINIIPFYIESYANQPTELTAMVTGTASPAVHWVVQSQPSGGDLVFSGANDTEKTHRLNALVSASVKGRYDVRAILDKDSSVYGDVTVYISGNELPYQVTANGTEPVDSDVDPELTGNVYDVGPSQTYHKIGDILGVLPTPAGTTIRVHNEGSNGSPTTYHEGLMIDMSGTPTQPIRIVGVPNAGGELPVIDGDGATPTSNMIDYFFSGLVNTWVEGCYGLYSEGSCGPKNIIVEGLKLQNARDSYSRISATDFTSSVQWVHDASAFSLHSGYNFVIRGNDIFNTGNGIATYAPANPLYAAITQWVLIEGNNIHQFGNNGSFTEHGIYAQSHGQVIEANNIHDPFTGDQGSGIKTRTDLDVANYNLIQGPVSRAIDEVEVQDDAMYFGFNFFGPDPMTYFSTGHSQDPGLDLTTMAGIVEGSRKRFVVGNIFDVGGVSIEHCSGDHDTGGDTDCRGTVYFTSNTVKNGGIILDPMGAGGQEEYYAEFPKFDVNNNIIDTDSPNIVLARSANFLGTFGANSLRSGTVDLTPPLTTAQNSEGQVFGWGPGIPNDHAWANGGAVDDQVSGLENMVLTNSQPFGADFRPQANSAVVGEATTLTGIAALMPPRRQFNPDLGYATARMDLTTLGAMDPSEQSLTLVSIAITPSTAQSITYPATVQFSASCTYSDGSTTDCTNTVTWSNSGSTSFTISASGLLSSENEAGTSSVVASSGGIQSNQVAVTVSAQSQPEQPHPYVYLGPGSVIGGKSGSGSFVIR